MGARLLERCSYAEIDGQIVCAEYAAWQLLGVGGRAWKLFRLLSFRVSGQVEMDEGICRLFAYATKSMMFFPPTIQKRNWRGGPVMLPVHKNS